MATIQGPSGASPGLLIDRWQFFLQSEIGGFTAIQPDPRSGAQPLDAAALLVYWTGLNSQQRAETLVRQGKSAGVHDEHHSAD